MGDSPVRKKVYFEKYQEPHLLGRKGDHPLSLNTLVEPIGYKYREGKVKRTLVQGVK